MSRVRRVFVLFVILSMFVVTVGSGCSNQPAAEEGTGGSPNPDVLIFATQNQVPSLDPANSSSMGVQRLVDLLYDPLVRLAPDSLEIVPALAEWTVSPDATEYTFTIRDDAVFSDGSPVTADSVVFSFRRVLDVGMTNAGPLMDIIHDDTMQVIDDKTVKFALDAPMPSFLAIIAGTGGLIVNPKVQDYYDGDDLGQGYLTDHAMGSGRFLVESFTPNGDAVFVRNDKWYGQQSKIDKFIARIVPEASTMRMLLEKGEIDMMEGRFLDWDTIEEMRKEPGVTIAQGPSMDMLRFFFNMDKPPFDDLRVRKAVAMGIDYDGILENIYHGNADRMRGGIPEGMMGYDDSAPLIETDPEQAKQLLAEAGYPDGFTTEWSIGSVDLWQKLSTKVQSDLAKIGINLEIREYALPALYEKYSAGEFTMGMSGWTPDYADPESLVWYFFYSEMAGPGYNWAFYRNDEVDDLILDARVEGDPQKREEMYKEITRLTNEDVPYIWIAQPYGAIPLRSWVNGYVLNPMATFAIPIELMSEK